MTTMTFSAPDMMELGSLLPELVTDSFANLQCCGLQQDSRQLRAGELFVALPGLREHGLDHALTARDAGCVALLVDRNDEAAARALATGLPVIAVASLRQRLVDLAMRFYGRQIADLILIGVTGTNGKTSCTQLLAQAFNRLGRRCASIGTLGWGFPERLTPQLHTTPDLLQLYRVLAELASQGAATVVMEVSSHALAQGRCAGLRFDTAIFTNISRDHLDYHGTMDDYRDSKRQLFDFEGLRRAVINDDDEFGRALLGSLRDGVQVADYGLGTGPGVSLQDAKFDDSGLTATLLTPWGAAPLRSRLLGRFNASNVLAVIATLGLHGVPLAAIAATVADLAPIPGRMELIAHPGQPTVVIDYAHTPDALTKAIDATRLHCQGRLWCVFGAGGDRDRGKRPLMGAAAMAGADRVVVTSDNPRSENPQEIIEDIVAGLGTSGWTAEPDRRAAIEGAIAAAASEDWVLIAGKGHENYQEVLGERRPFSDVQVARQALTRREGGS